MILSSYILQIDKPQWPSNYCSQFLVLAFSFRIWMVSKSFQFATTRSSHTRLIGCMNSVFTSLDTGVFPAWYTYIVCLTLFLALLFRLTFILFLECFCNAFVDSLVEAYVFDMLHDDSYSWMYEKSPSKKQITSLLKHILE